MKLILSQFTTLRDEVEVSKRDLIECRTRIHQKTNEELSESYVGQVDLGVTFKKDLEYLDTFSGHDVEEEIKESHALMK
jgi:hypothetical protein